MRPPGSIPKNCEKCGKRDSDLRPYGQNFEYICYDCGMKNKDATHDQMLRYLYQLHGDDDYS